MTCQQPLQREKRQAAKKANQFLEDISKSSTENEINTRKEDDELFVDINGQCNRTPKNNSDNPKHSIYVTDNEIAIIISNYKANVKSVGHGEESVFRRFGIRSDKSNISLY